MDAQTRHELKQNELAQALMKLRLIAEKQAGYWVAGLVVVMLAWAGYYIWRTSHRVSIESAWKRLSTVNPADPTAAATAQDTLRSLISENVDPHVVAAARLRLGTILADEALREPARREVLLREAIDVLTRVAQDERAPTAIVAPALFKLAAAYESLRDLDRARQTYEQIVHTSRLAGTPFPGLAQARLESLDELARPVAFVAGEPPPPAAPGAPAVPDVPDTAVRIPFAPAHAAPTTQPIEAPANDPQDSRSSPDDRP